MLAKASPEKQGHADAGDSGQNADGHPDQPDEAGLEKDRAADLAGGGAYAREHTELFRPLTDRDGEGVVDQGHGSDEDEAHEHGAHAVQHRVEGAVAAAAAEIEQRVVQGRGGWAEGIRIALGQRGSVPDMAGLKGEDHRAVRGEGGGIQGGKGGEAGG